MKKKAFDRFAIIGSDIHRLVYINPKDDWTEFAWRIKHNGNYYWVPVPNENKDGMIGL